MTVVWNLLVFLAHPVVLRKTSRVPREKSWGTVFIGPLKLRTALARWSSKRASHLTSDLFFDILWLIPGWWLLMIFPCLLLELLFSINFPFDWYVHIWQFFWRWIASSDLKFTRMENLRKWPYLIHLYAVFLALAIFRKTSQNQPDHRIPWWSPYNCGLKKLFPINSP